LRKLLSVIILFSIIAILNTKSSAAETAGISNEKMTLIQECEKIFPDLENLGVEKFRQRYQHFPSFRSCTVLYDDPIWYSNDVDRIEKLASLLEKPLQQTQIRDRFVQTPTIPEWIKDDAKRWQQGKEKDNILSYGIRFLINSNMISTPTSISAPIYCEDRICVAQNDFLKYSIKDSSVQDVITLTHIFQNISEDSLVIIASQVSKSGRSSDSFKINHDGLVYGVDQKCCKYYKFMHKLPLELGSKINSDFDGQLTGEVVYPFKEQKRSAFVAKDRPGSYYEVIDAQTGVVLFAKHHDRIKKTVWTAELADTNIFTKDIKIQYEDMRIPPWFRDVVKWWTEGIVSDDEYLSAMSYLLKQDILRI
jgi:hypothetical protein